MDYLKICLFLFKTLNSVCGGEKDGIWGKLKITMVSSTPRDSKVS